MDLNRVAASAPHADILRSVQVEFPTSRVCSGIYSAVATILRHRLPSITSGIVFVGALYKPFGVRDEQSESIIYM